MLKLSQLCARKLETSPLTLLTRHDSLSDRDFEAGTILLIDKPAGISSFQVVRRVRRLCSVRKVGHCGTLDPAATGLMIVLTGKGTRQQDQFMRLDKEYVATILAGIQTDTWDLDGRILAQERPPDLDRGEVAILLQRDFSGEIEQTPPIFSALKYGGVPYYRRARRGEQISPAKRRVKVHGIELEDWAWPEMVIRLSCSSGFYVRALAHDLGSRLGCGAVLKSLRRTRVGTYHVEDAWPLADLETKFTSQEQTKGTCPT